MPQDRSIDKQYMQVIKQTIVDSVLNVLIVSLFLFDRLIQSSPTLNQNANHQLDHGIYQGDRIWRNFDLFDFKQLRQV